VKILPLAYIRSETDAEKFYAAFTDLIGAAFPARIRSVYLLSSRADGSAILTSDVDFAIVFQDQIDDAERPLIKKILNALQGISPVMLDTLVTSEAEVHRGITPTLQHYRLLSGPDILRDLPLRPKPELMLYFAGLVIHFIQAIRGQSGPLHFPLAYPGPVTGYCGYEKFGTRTGEGEYRPGLNLLVTLVLAIASYRLADLADVFTRAKSATVPNYEKHLPDDFWRPMIVELHRLARTRLGGKLPTEASDRDRLYHWCPRVLDLENEFLGSLIMSIESWLPIEEPSYRRQLEGFVRTLECASPVHTVQLAKIKSRLNSGT
jgi:hypothetical protein